VDAPDLQAAATRLPATGVRVVLIEHPWRLQGRRIAPNPARLDETFRAVVAALAPRTPFVVGGRSAGARVACRTARELGAAGVLAFAFPLDPPSRPGRSRLPELLGAGVPTLVVQGTRDAFGSATALSRAVPVPVATATTQPPGVDVVAVAGADHGFHMLQRDGGPAARERRLADALDVVRSWLSSVAGVGEQSGHRLG
jgi:predicted alpha/beta-hydrolase family hydrolase